MSLINTVPSWCQANTRKRAPLAGNQVLCKIDLPQSCDVRIVMVIDCITAGFQQPRSQLLEPSMIVSTATLKILFTRYIFYVATNTIKVKRKDDLTIDRFNEHRRPVDRPTPFLQTHCSFRPFYYLVIH